jgi:Fur family zinc uptake transcriptional regulator
MTKLNTIIQHAEKNCKAHGTKLTDKRKLVLAGLLKSDKAMSAYELVDYCKDELGETLPPMSVYRILDFLHSENLVHKLNLANKYIACAHITCEHSHGVPQFLICSNCLRVKEIQIEQSIITALKSNVEAAHFHLTSPQLEMHCLCNKCCSEAA